MRESILKATRATRRRMPFVKLEAEWGKGTYRRLFEG